MSHNKEVIGFLNDLIETSKDEEKGFRDAASRVGHDGESELRTVLDRYAQQRAGFTAQLRNEVLRRGGEPVESGHVSATLRRGWRDFKSAIKAGPDYADKGDYEIDILAACEAGEKAAMENYEAILKANLPADLLDLVKNQYLKIRQVHEEIRSLSDEYKPVA